MTPGYVGDDDDDYTYQNMVIIRGVTQADTRTLGSRAFSLHRQADLTVCIDGNKRNVVKDRYGTTRSISKRELDRLKGQAAMVQEVRA
jgi:ABC-type histidine transport system ATPase subunit